MGIYSDYIFPRFYDFVVCHKGFDEQRPVLLQKAQGKILEIGIGTGLNLYFYPEHVAEITAIDPNPGMERQIRAKLKGKLHGRGMKVNFFLAGAENLPFKDTSFDTVVSTITMCTIPDLQKALSEIRRVLRPQGRLIFLDHGLSPEPRVARMQRFLNPLQNIIGCGCKLTVDVESELEAADFKITELKKYYVSPRPKVLTHVYEGEASP
jgi:ubiquinone/menaquinone biosynthesis C-methylase UbiE